MYRTRVNAVSGAKVFADGKWLQCIGNKNFHVGELVWTDGRCVFGNHRDIQQPLVIPAPKKEDFAIPIICGNCYNFAKSKINLLKEYNNRRIFIINDKKGNVYTFYHAIEGRYGHVAANIDDTGNIFTLSVESDMQENLSVTIKKNGEFLSEFNFTSIVNEMENACPDVPPVWSIPAANHYFHYEGYSIRWAFIENADKWAFVVSAEYDKEIYPEPLLPEHKDGLHVIGDREVHNLTRWYFFDADGNKKILQEFFWSYERITDETLERYDSSREFSDVTFPLQDNFYYKSEYFPIPTDGYNTVSGEKRSIFSSDGTKIFTGIFYAFSYITVKKVQNGYLLGVWLESASSEYYLSDGIQSLQNTDILLFDAGLFLLKNGSWEVLSTESACFNQRLRPMTKFKNWEKRIKSLT